jgi:hypothetical protein
LQQNLLGDKDIISIVNYCINEGYFSDVYNKNIKPGMKNFVAQATEKPSFLKSKQQKENEEFTRQLGASFVKPSHIGGIPKVKLWKK